MLSRGFSLVLCYSNALENRTELRWRDSCYYVVFIIKYSCSFKNRENSSRGKNLCWREISILSEIEEKRSVCQTRSFQNCPAYDLWEKGRNLLPVSQQICRIGCAGSMNACGGLRHEFFPTYRILTRYREAWALFVPVLHTEMCLLEILKLIPFYFFSFSLSVANIYM